MTLCGGPAPTSSTVCAASRSLLACERLEPRHGVDAPLIGETGKVEAWGFDRPRLLERVGDHVQQMQRRVEGARELAGVADRVDRGVAEVDRNQDGA